MNYDPVYIGWNGQLLAINQSCVSQGYDLLTVVTHVNLKKKKVVFVCLTQVLDLRRLCCAFGITPCHV